MNQQLSDYINQSRKTGATDEQIKQALATAGWPEYDINEAMSSAAGFAVSSPIVPRATLETDQQSFINKWSWGGFLLYFVYFLGSRNYKRVLLYFLGLAIPIFDIYLLIKSGLRGRKLVWESGKWQDFESYHKRQKLLDKIGFALVLATVLIWITFFAFGYVSLLKKGNQAVVQPVGQEISPTSSAVQAVVPVPDLFAGIKVTLDKFNQIKSKAESAPLFSRASQKDFAQSKGSFIPGTKFEFESGTMNTAGDEAQVKIKITESGKAPSEQTIIFVLEDGQWKGDLPKTIAYLFANIPINGTTTHSGVKVSQPSVPLEIAQATLTPSQLTYPFSGVALNVTLRNKSTQAMQGYKYRFFLDGASYFGQVVGGNKNLFYIGPVTTFSMDQSDTQSAVSQLAKSCDFSGLDAGQYNIHLKVSTDITKQLNADTTGPLVTDKLIPFTLTTACQKKAAH